MFKKAKSKTSANLRKKRSQDDDESQQASPDHELVIRPTEKRSRATLLGGATRHEDRTTKSLFDERAFESSNTAVPLGPQDMGATAENIIDTEQDRDRVALLERRHKLAESLKDQADDKVYRGQAAYSSYQAVRESVISSHKEMRTGPIRASGNIRVTARFDYQPDVCKDYKETGYCGYGDSCKFLHDRGDYKSGWQIDQEFEREQKMKREAELAAQLEDESNEPGAEDDDLPFACLICRDPFKDPVVTKCGHYFCERCAIDQFKKSPKCFSCSRPTHGVFDVAKDLMAKLKDKEERIRQQETELRALNTGHMSGDELE